MFNYIVRRVLFAIPIALGVTIVCFSLVYLAPGDPLQLVLPPDATADDRAILATRYGFDKPIPVQYLNWLMRALCGDMGVSIQTSRPVFGEVIRALGNTVVISVGAVALAFTVAFILG